jgi:hypothetical protein
MSICGADVLHMIHTTKGAGWKTRVLMTADISSREKGERSRHNMGDDKYLRTCCRMWII